MQIEVNGQTVNFENPNAELCTILNEWIDAVWAEHPELSRCEAQRVAMDTLREKALELKHDKDNHAS